MTNSTARIATTATAPARVLRIQHRETGCWLRLEGNTPWWVSRRDIHHATVLRDPGHAREIARRLQLSQKQYRITADDSIS